MSTVTAHKPTAKNQAKSSEGDGHISTEDLLSQFHVQPDKGLTTEEARDRLGEQGYNELEEKRVHPVLKFLSYFWGPIPWMIEVAVILSAVVRDWTDFGIILVLLLANAVVGFWEEHQAGNAIDALKKKLALNAYALRDGSWKEIPARELVTGDVIRLRFGAIIPADARLLEGDPVQVDQSALTGESLPVERKVGQDVYSGSVLTQGEAQALVTATGKNTYFGRTAEMMEGQQASSHFQKAVMKIGDYLILLAVLLVLIIIGAALFRDESFLTVLQFSLVLTVAAIPVAMPTVLSVTMAVGARLLAARQAIVRRLAAIEELAGIDVLCSDKTGTLTQNKLTLGDPVPIDEADSHAAVLAAALASRSEDADPIDAAVLGGVSDSEEVQAYGVTHFTPFDPVHKRTEARVKGPDGKTFTVSKGAPQVILSLLDESSRPQTRPKVEAAVNELASRGYRSLGVARTDSQGRWRYLAVLPLYDPPREDSADTVQAALQMGVNMKMVTGDQGAIGREIARQIGLGTNILDAKVFDDTKHHETGRLEDQVETADGFAEVFPEHKHHIVDVLQKKGHIVGMTGDGVNDAPALKKADAGIAVSGATDAARSVADIVLLSPGLSVIIEAIRESRKIFQRMNSYATYRIAETIRVLLFMTLSILIFRFYPVTPVMIVLLALLNDGAILSIAYDRATASDHPERWQMRRVLGVATALGIAGVISTFGLFYLADRVFGLDRGVIQTLVYLKLSVAGHLTIFVTRTEGRFWSRRPAWVLLGAVVVTQIAATLIAGFGLFMTPLPWIWVAAVWGYALAWFLVNDQVKVLMHRILGAEQPSLLDRRKRRAA